MATYSGPADNLVIGEQVYHPGDDMPISAEQQAALESAGHIFADTDMASVAARNMSMPLAPMDTAPRDARGAIMTFAPAPTATAPKASPSSTSSSTSSTPS